MLPPSSVSSVHVSLAQLQSHVFRPSCFSVNLFLHINKKLGNKHGQLQEKLSNPIPMCVCQAPLFLLFLDAVWQLLEQYPAAFEFSETYLAVLHDSTRVPLFGTFLFNSPHQRVKQSTVSELQLGLHGHFLQPY